MRKLAVLVLASFLAGCATTPTAEQQAIVDVSARIAIRHFLDDSRKLEKARNIRAVIFKIEDRLSTELTVGTLVAQATKEIDKLDIKQIEKDDAKDLLGLLAVSLESRVGSGQLSNDAIVKTREFLAQVLAVLPAA